MGAIGSDASHQVPNSKPAWDLSRVNEKARESDIRAQHNHSENAKTAPSFSWLGILFAWQPLTEGPTLIVVTEAVAVHCICKIVRQQRRTPGSRDHYRT